MEVDIRWRPELELATVSYQGALIDSEAHFGEWKRKVLPRLESIFERVGRRYPLLVDIDELQITPQFSPRYRDEIIPVVTKWCEPIVRHGTAANVRVIVALEAMRGAYQANIFDDFDEAVKFVKGQKARAVMPESPAGG